MTTKKPRPDRFEEAMEAAITTGRRLMRGARHSEDTCDTSHGLLAGAIEHWLAAHQPCGHADCGACKRYDTPEKRLAELIKLVDRFGRASQDLHAERDVKAASGPSTVQ